MKQHKNHGLDMIPLISWNPLIAEGREIPPLKMLDSIWHKLMANRFKRHQAADAEAISPLQPLTLHGQKLLQQALFNAQQHIPQMHSPDEGRIRKTGGATYLVH